VPRARQEQGWVGGLDIFATHVFALTDSVSKGPGMVSTVDSTNRRTSAPCGRVSPSLIVPGRSWVFHPGKGKTLVEVELARSVESE
jgi:hypothetical protein